MENKKFVWFKRIPAAILAYIFLLSLKQIINLWGSGYGFYGVGLLGYNIWAVGLYVFTVWILYRMFNRGEKKLHITAGILGMLLSLVIVYGSYAHFLNDIFQSKQVTLLQIGLVFGFLPVTMPLSEEFLLLFDRLRNWCIKKEEDKPRAIDAFFQKRGWVYFALVWIIIFASYIPIFLACWPGNFVYDAPFQITEVIYGEYETHHPLMHTLLMGWAYNLGISIGDVSTGYQFYTLIQMLVLSGSFAYCVYYLYKKRVPRVFRVGVLLWFALFPMHAVYSVSATKDIMFSAFFLYFAVFLVRLLFDREQFKWYSYAGLIVSGVLSVLLRNNAAYAIIAGGVILVIFEKGWKQKGRIVGILATVYVLSNVANLGLVAALDAEDTDSYKESLSVPLQCLGRVASYRGDELSEELYNEICMYIPESAFANYNPYLADEVKGPANEELLRENIFNFIKLWIKVGIQFPDEYIESFLTNNLAYWYPLDRGQYVQGSVEFYHKLIWVGPEIEKRTYCSWAGDFYGELFWQGEYLEVPILGYLFRAEVWVWFLNFFLAWSIMRKHKKTALMGAIPFMYLCTCYLGPTVVLRYIYCIVVIVPLLLYLVMRGGEDLTEAPQIEEERVVEE